MRYSQRQNGYAILIVLIAVAIVLILYASQMKALFLPDVQPDHTAVQQRPWLLEELLAGAGEAVQLPRSPKPELDAAFAIPAAVRRDGKERGQVTLGFKTTGRVEARWTVQYMQNEKTYAIRAELEGNVDVKRTWEDADGTDKSRLFFIARGPYQRQAAGGSEPDEEGIAWLIGWLGADRTVTGHIALTTDRKRSAVYEFAGGGEGDVMESPIGDS